MIRHRRLDRYNGYEERPSWDIMRGDGMHDVLVFFDYQWCARVYREHGRLVILRDHAEVSLDALAAVDPAVAELERSYLRLYSEQNGL